MCIDANKEATIQSQTTSMMRLLEVMAIRDTLVFMNKQLPTVKTNIPNSIQTQDMEGYDYDEAALARLEAKLLQRKEPQEEE